jgi:hypothetical protein
VLLNVKSSDLEVTLKYPGITSRFPLTSEPFKKLSRFISQREIIVIIIIIGATGV